MSTVTHLDVVRKGFFNGVAKSVFRINLLLRIQNLNTKWQVYFLFTDANFKKIRFVSLRNIMR